MTTAPGKDVREVLKAAKRIVVKIGSRSLAARPGLSQSLAQQIKSLRDQGRVVVLVSSGAVALGMERLGFPTRPTEVGQLQAAASAGQSELMRRYDEAFRPLDLVVAQVLLTHGDLSNRRRVNNARNALAALIEAGAVPIINENDAVATEELRFSDNDQLSAMVAPLVDADALALLTDVDGVLDQHGQRISILDKISDFTDRGQTGNVGRGGMASKLDAAQKARHAGAAVVIASALEDNILLKILSGADVGTALPQIQGTLRARHHWIAYALRPRGTVLVDPGAAHAVSEGNKSLLPVGVVGLRGEFRRGDAIKVETLDGKEIARGLSRMSALEVARAAGKRGSDLLNVLGGDSEAIVIHKDDLVLLG